MVRDHIASKRLAAGKTIRGEFRLLPEKYVVTDCIARGFERNT